GWQSTTQRRPDASRWRPWAPGLFDLDAGGFDDGPPFFDFTLVERGQPFRRLLLARRDIESEVREPALDGGIGERLHHGGVQPGDDFLRRAFGREETEPAGRVEAGNAALRGSRDRLNHR